MYLALVIFQLGIGMSLSFIHISLMALLTIIVLDYYVIKREEAYLKIKFGEQYENIREIQEDGFDCICFWL